MPVFDTKHMIISLLTDPRVMNKKNFAEGYNVLTGEVNNHSANNVLKQKVTTHFYTENI